LRPLTSDKNFCRMARPTSAKSAAAMVNAPGPRIAILAAIAGHVDHNVSCRDGHRRKDLVGNETEHLCDAGEVAPLPRQAMDLCGKRRGILRGRQQGPRQGDRRAVSPRDESDEQRRIPSPQDDVLDVPISKSFGDALELKPIPIVVDRARNVDGKHEGRIDALDLDTAGLRVAERRNTRHHHREKRLPGKGSQPHGDLSS
jgi:hypothetical protein